MENRVQQPVIAQEMIDQRPKRETMTIKEVTLQAKG